jgi:hydrogenase-4 component F
MAEMLILSGIVQAGNLIAFTLMCTMLTIIFVATGRSIFPMIWGPSEHQGPKVTETWVTAVPKLGFVVVLVLLGVYTPAPISALLVQVAQSIGGQ